MSDALNDRRESKLAEMLFGNLDEVAPKTADYAFEQVLPDGQTVRVLRRAYNSQLSISKTKTCPWIENQW